MAHRVLDVDVLDGLLGLGLHVLDGLLARATQLGGRVLEGLVVGLAEVGVGVERDLAVVVCVDAGVGAVPV